MEGDPGASLVTFVATSDLDTAVAFYHDTLGLPLKDRDAFAAVLDANGVPIRITPVDHVSVAPYTVLGWDVGDIESVVSALAARGVEFMRYSGLAQDDLLIWTAPSGAR